MTKRPRKQSFNSNGVSYSHLEKRQLLSADLAVDPLGSAEAKPAHEWAEIDWKGESVLARNDQWIIWQDNQEGIQAANQNSLKIGDETALTSFSASASDAATKQKLQVTRELGSGLFLLSGSENFSYEQVAESVAEWVPNAIVEPDFKLTATSIPNDTSFGQQWGLNNTGQSGGLFDADIDAVEAWDVTTGSSEVVVGVIDTGIDYTHPDLVDNIWTNPGEIAGDGIDNDNNGYIDDIHGWDFADNDNDPFDDDGHGTHVAGTIGATGNNGLGVSGVSQDVTLVAIKFLGADGGSTSGAIASVEYANTLRSQGVNIVMTNNSWGGGGFSTALETAIQNAEELDILFVAAAGNSATDTRAYPASYDLDNIISVAATDRNDQLASFSNFHPTRVDIAAPGVTILSTRPGGGYQNLSGTSMASPHVAGALALLAASEPDLTALELRDRLLESVDVLPQLNGVVATSGRLNVNSLLEKASAVNFTAASFVTPGAVSFDIVDQTGFAADAEVTIVSSSGDSETLTISPAGSFEFSTSIDAVAGSANVNDGILQVASGDTLTVTYFDADAESDDGPGILHSDEAVIFGDDHGDDGATATPVGSPFDVAGNLDLSGDSDWFRFDAVAGLQYEFETVLGSLTDSTLTLYGTDGTSQLRFDDDGGRGLASRIVWSAPVSGSYYLEVLAYANNKVGTYQLTGSAASSVVLDVIASGTEFSSEFIDAIDGEGLGAGNGLGYSLTGDHQLQTLPWVGVDTIYVQFSDDVSASIAAGDIVLTGSGGKVYDMQMVTYDTESNTAEFLIDDGIDIDSLVVSILDGAVGNANGGLLDGEWGDGQTGPSGDGNVGGQFDFFFNVLPGDEDGSGQINSSDAFGVFAFNGSASNEVNQRSDVNGSGQITSTDAFLAFANNAFGLPAPPTAPVSSVATTSPTRISLAANDEFFAKELSSLRVEDFEASRANEESATVIDSTSSDVVAQPLFFAASALEFAESTEIESQAIATVRQDVVVNDDTVQSLDAPRQAFATPDLSNDDQDEEKQTSSSKQRFSAEADLLDDVEGTLSGAQSETSL